MTAKEYAKIAIAALEDHKAEDVKVIDIHEISPVADYFVIASGNNQNQLQAMRDAAEESLHKAGLAVKQIEGNATSTWVLMDYGDIIIHIFSKEDRLFYDLERIWRDGIILDAKDFE
jgi:ribosome-associated protein